MPKKLFPACYFPQIVLTSPTRIMSMKLRSSIRAFALS